MRNVLEHSQCKAAWGADTSKGRAQSFDAQFPECCCEGHSLTSDRSGVAQDELVARIFTTPDSYRQDKKEIIWNKLVRAFSDGLSMFRSGCSADEIRAAVARLTTSGAEPTTLAGATLIEASMVRAIGTPCRWFCVYDTDAAEFSIHSDIIGTWPDRTLSKTKTELEKQTRLRSLRDAFDTSFVPSTSADELIAQLRARNFYVVGE